MTQKYDLQSAAYHADPWPTLNRMLADGPVIDSRMPLIGKVWWVTGHDAVQEFLKSQDRFVSDPRNIGKKNMFGVPWLPRTYRILMENILMLDDPRHRRLRKFVDAPFRKGWIDQYRPTIAAIADRLLDDMEQKGEKDITGHFARELPLEVICEILGLQGNREMFKRWMADMTGSMSAWLIISMIPRLRNILKYMQGEIDRVRATPGPGLLSEMVHAEADGEQMSDEELLSMVVILFIAGHETTVHLISMALHSFITHPEQLEILRGDYALMPQAVEEVMRYAAPVQATKPRMARQDMEFHGARLKKGDRCMAVLATANIDGSVFDDPLAFNILRDDKARHVGFGGGIHLCLGIHLARAEAQIALERVFRCWENIRFAVPESELDWHKRLGLRGFKALPLEWDLVG